MNYLTFNEFSNLSEREMSEEAFDRHYKSAAAILDHVTQFFYRFNDIEQDIPFRKEQFKKALVAQIEHFNVIGLQSFNEAADTPQSFSIGQTSITNKSGRTKDETNDLKPLIALDVYVHLDGTGLLYRGG